MTVQKRHYPNIVIFNPDQFRADAVGHLGNEAAITPNFDRMARTDAVSFRYAFCQSTVCTPSRCSFMTGWYPHVRGHRTMFHMLRSDEPNLLKTLKNHGYTIWWGGKNDLIPAGTSLGDCCDIKFEPKGYIHQDLHIDQRWRGPRDGSNWYSFYAGKLDKGTDEIHRDLDWSCIQGAIDFIHSSPKDKPICIYLPLIYPHPPYAVEEPWYSAVDRRKIRRIRSLENWDDKPSILKGIYELQALQSWTEEKWAELRATYYGMCSRIDYQLGMILNALQEAEIYDDTAVFVFSDHGDFTGDYGLVEKTQNTFEDCLTRVPFIIKPPRWVRTNPRISDALVELIDFPATVEALVGIDPEHTHFGRSLLSLVAGETDDHRDAVFAEGGRLMLETHCMERESAEDPLIADLYMPRLKMQWSDGPQHTKGIMIRTKTHKYVRRLYESDELYDLENDPQEVRNVIEDPTYELILSGLKERLLTFYQDTCDVVPHITDRRW